MTFDEWLASLHLDEPDAGGQAGIPVAGTTDFLRELFDAYDGSVPRAALNAAWHEREIQLISHAVALVEGDLRRTTTLTPVIEIRTLDDGTVAVTYNGSYQTPVLHSIRDPEAICDVADNIRDQVVDDLRYDNNKPWTSSSWPVCPRDGLYLDPVLIDGQAVWHCRLGKHTISPIGQLRNAG